MPDPTPATLNPQAPVAPAQKPAQAPAQPPVTPTPGAKPGEPAPITPQGDKTVPISALLEEREKRQALQQEIENLKSIVGQNVLFDSEGRPVQYQQPQPQPNRYQQELEKLWEVDPRKAVQAEIYQAMSWRDQQDAEIDKQESDASRKYPDFNNYRSEVRQYVRTLPLEQRSQKGIVDLAYYVVRGQKVDNIIAKTREQIETEIRQKLASGQGLGPLPGGSSGEPPAPNPSAMTDEEKKAADAMGVPYEDYARYKKM